jgi:AraC-like DNA-binding protein
MESDDSVGLISNESGFNNMTNFTEQFKKMVKCTPYQFKKKMARGDYQVDATDPD